MKASLVEVRAAICDCQVTSISKVEVANRRFLNGQRSSVAASGYFLIDAVGVCSDVGTVCTVDIQLFGCRRGPEKANTKNVTYEKIVGIEKVC